MPTPNIKTFVGATVLTASDVNDYLMKQTVIYSTSSLRPTSPQDGMTIYESDLDRYKTYHGGGWYWPATIGVWNGSTAEGTFIGTSITANRSFTLPDVSGTVITTGNLSSITAVGTLTSGSIPATLLTGTVASARLSGSYTGITAVGTLTSLSISGTATVNGVLNVDGASSSNIRIGDWTNIPAYSAIGTDWGYLLLGQSFDLNVYLRSIYGVVYIGTEASNTIAVSSTQGQLLDGSAGTPSLTFQNDTNTGIYRAFADWLNITCGGSGMVTFTTSGAFFATNTTTSTVTWRVDTFNRLGTPTSTRVSKDNITDLADDQALTIVRSLRPRTFTWKPEPDDSEYLSRLKSISVQAGFIVEEIAETSLPFSMLEYKPDITEGMTEDQQRARATDLASYVPYYWKEAHLIAILTQVVKNLDNRITALEES